MPCNFYIMSRSHQLTGERLPDLQGSATLSMAYAGALFADACLRGLNGEPNVVECAFVDSKVTELPFFASRIKLGTKGAPSAPVTHICSRAGGPVVCISP